MEVNGPTKRAIVGIVVTSMAMLFSLLVPTQSAEASSYSGPCPHYSIQDVFDDPSGNWDGDQVNNSDELYNGLNPCVVDTGTFCQAGGVAICNYSYTYTHGHYVTYVAKDTTNNPCHRSTYTLPYDDYDRDGVNNTTELARGTDPCIYNAPAVVHQVACPHYNVHQVTAAPNYDWDGDGVTNLVEWRRGTNPCVYNAAVVYQPAPVQATTYRLPHVANTYRPTTVVRHVVIAVSVPAQICPAGYPYFHPGNGQCYANPVKQLFS